ncbi:hypothetical protein [Paradevosia shaoguanensis]|uniref:Histidine kinase n=1 Tax=Paradevosia shaoguanensis TaxID=1335043 RepID=A0AA41QSH8_9HYPH|nr:hypothetical protein [Paradevosia shaoguanensis]MCF1745044.1 hypothetical protein [Paradevosia shaoguanensis]MCI0129527.1 hypothetical protein [Paradevosia shaoguanensis]
MPTLIRLVIALLFIVGLGYAAMFALTVMVDPGEKEITVRIPARELVAQPVRLPDVQTTSNPTLPAQAPVPITTSTPSNEEAPLVQPGGPE